MASILCTGLNPSRLTQSQGIIISSGGHLVFYAPSTRSQTMAKRKPANTESRVRTTVNAPTSTGNSLAALRSAAKGCRNCELWKDATQTVFGEGPARARVLVVGEQPGNEEDLQGRPFVGPAGKLFDKAVAELGLDRSAMYVTNAVKHFRFEMRGKFRLHRSPTSAHVRACHVWLEGELRRVKPDIVVCLGAIAAKAVFGSGFGLMRERGTWQELPGGARGFATVHPSWVLRQRDSASREQAYRDFVADLELLVESRS
ncbi:UdgX family uracil-DNA binding protein [Lysobacter sp. M15]|uniref:UdgX family uracil-DNA binding protein n=1 Tax=Lysobacter sp. M15 TaxID=2916837 RepID=UPI001F57F17C|nr:UdgX family uracil-DNA binding protein [Lysobacter sp. M15]